MQRRRGFIGAALVIGALVAALTPALGIPAGAAPVAPAPPVLGPVISRLAGLDEPDRPAAAVAPAATSPLGLMTYHGGPVMHHVTAYTVYWQPGTIFMSPKFKSLINQWLTDIGNTTTYNTVQQYGDGSGPPGLDVTFGGTWTNTAGFPHRGGGQLNPITGQDIANVALTALAANPTWSNDTNHIIFVYLPKGVFLSGGAGTISGRDFCAYHFAYGLNGEKPIHPVGAMAYDGSDLAHCASPTSPNNDIDADSEVNTTAHEFFDSVANPTPGNMGSEGWYFSGANGELSDQCNFVFGPTDAQGANVILNGHRYIMQTQWSNNAANPANPQQATGCVIRSSIQATTSLVSSVNPSIAGRSVTIAATVTPSGAHPTGTVQFRDGGTALGAPVALSGATAIFTTTGLPAGANSMTAAYSGDGNFTPSVSAPLVQTVNLAAANFTFPVNGQSNVDTTRAFTWSTIPQAQGYLLVVGTTRHGTNLANSGVLPPSQSSFTGPALPTGVTLFGTILTEVNGAWDRFQDVTFTAAPGLATLTSPTNGQANVDTTQPFRWATIPQGQGYVLAVGTSPLGTNLVNSGVLAPSQSSFPVPALPTGTTLYATLLTKVNGAFTRYQAVTFTAAPGQGTFTSPTNGQRNVNHDGSFTWSTIPQAEGYILVVGTTVFGDDLVNSGALAATESSFPVTSLPVGRILYATLLTKVNGAFTRFALVAFTAV